MRTANLNEGGQPEQLRALAVTPSWSIRWWRSAKAERLATCLQAGQLRFARKFEVCSQK